VTVGETARSASDLRLDELCKRLNELACEGEPLRFSAEKWDALRAGGLTRLPFAQQHGGLGEDLLGTMHVLEDFGHGCYDGGLGFSLCTHLTSTGVPLQRFGSEELKARLLPRVCDGSAIGAHAITESVAGSDVMSMETSAEDRGDHFVLNGRKTFVTNAPVADLLVVYAKVGTASGPFSLSAFVVERGAAGLRIGEPIEKMGLDGSPLGEVVLDGCEVGRGNVLGKPGSGFLVLDHVMKWEVLCTFALAAGSMRRRLQTCIDHARRRHQFGRPIGSFDLLADKVVDMKISIETARGWLYSSATRLLRGQDATMEIAIAKLLASEANLSSALAAVQVLGARGYAGAYGAEADLRDAVGGLIYSGTSEIQRKKIARMLGVGEHLRNDPRGLRADA
jgi:alkylation response protein AidB-like acyl-CoA dehydrogenase